MGKSQSPGPIYKLPPVTGYKDHDFSRYRNPAYTISPRLGKVGAEKGGPGPVYQVSGLTEHGKSSPPAYSMSSRYPRIEGFRSPGPGAHSPEKCPPMSGPRPPAWTMAPRHRLHVDSLGPGPLAYNLPSMLGPKVPNKHANPGYSISPRLPHALRGLGPGPAGYAGVKCDVYKNAEPKYTMRPRWQTLSEKGGSPGPAAYLPKKGRCDNGPAYSMGRKYGEIYSPYITPQDELPCAD